MQRVRILVTQNGSRDGLTNEMFWQGREYSLPDDLIEQLFHLGACELVDDAVSEPEIEDKMVRPKRGRPRKNAAS